MYNTLYEDESHGLKVWEERQARRRAAEICRRVGLRITPEYLDQLDIKSVRRIIREGLGVLETNSALASSGAASSPLRKQSERGNA